MATFDVAALRAAPGRRPVGPLLTASHAHWTGHASRLDRDLTGRFGDRSYGADELVAELCAAFWCAQFGLEQATRSNHAAYLGDWLALLAADSRALLTACSHAQRAIDHLNVVAGRTPLHAPVATAGCPNPQSCDA